MRIHGRVDRLENRVQHLEHQAETVIIRVVYHDTLTGEHEAAQWHVEITCGKSRVVWGEREG